MNYEKFNKTVQEIKANQEEDKYTTLAKRIELKDVQTVEKLMKKLDTAVAKVPKLTQDLTAQYNVVQTLEKEYDDLEVKYKKLQDDQMKVGNKWEKAKDVWEKKDDKLIDALQNTGLFDLENAVNALENAAKALGVTKVPLVGKARSAMNKAKKVLDKGYNVRNKRPQG